MNRFTLWRSRVGLLRAAQRGFSTTSMLRRIYKISPSATEAISKISSGSTMLVGGFGFSGVPNTLINAVAARPLLKDLTVVSNNAGMPGVGLGRRYVLLHVGSKDACQDVLALI
jgi:hypothetical protein